MKKGKAIKTILPLFVAPSLLAGCDSSCNISSVNCPTSTEEETIQPREFEDKDKGEAKYHGEDVYVTSLKKNAFGETYIDYDGKPLQYNGVQIRTDAFMNTDKWNEEDIEVLFKTAKEAGFDIVEVPLEWADIEIEKDVFDYYYVFKVLEYARKYDLKVEFLWFGTNMCGDTHSYTVPDYILRDGKTYPKFDAPRTGEFWSYYGIMWYLDFSNENLLEREGNALNKILDYIYEYDSTHGAKKSVISFQVHNEADIFARWRIFTTGKEVIDPKTGKKFEKKDAFKHVTDALNYLGKIIKAHKYKIITRTNVATGTKGDSDGEYSGIYDKNGDVVDIRSFIKDFYSLEGIDMVGDDCYNATLKDVKGIEKMYREKLNGNFSHIAENDGNYANTSSLLLTSAVMKSGYLVYELATSPFFKKNNSSDIDQGIYKVNTDKTLTPKAHASSIKQTLEGLRACSSPLNLAKYGNVLGFNLNSNSPQSSLSQTIQSENVKVNFETTKGASGYVVDYENSLYAYFFNDVSLNFENVSISKAESGSLSDLAFTAKGSLSLNTKYNLEANTLYKFDYTNRLNELVSTAFDSIGGNL